MKLFAVGHISYDIPLLHKTFLVSLQFLTFQLPSFPKTGQPLVENDVSKY